MFFLSVPLYRMTLLEQSRLRFPLFLSCRSVVLWFGARPQPSPCESVVVLFPLTRHTRSQAVCCQVPQFRTGLINVALHRCRCLFGITVDFADCLPFPFSGLSGFVLESFPLLSSRCYSLSLVSRFSFFADMSLRPLVATMTSRYSRGLSTFLRKMNSSGLFPSYGNTPPSVV